MTKEHHNDKWKLSDVCSDCWTQEYMIVAVDYHALYVCLVCHGKNQEVLR